MSESRFTIVARYRESGYAAADLSDLRDAFAKTGQIETEALALPEAGGSWDLWINAKAIIEGLEAAVLYDVLKTLASQSVRWFRARRRSAKFEPELHAIEVRSERLSVSVRTADDKPMDPERAVGVADLLPAEFSQKVLAERDIRVIVVLIGSEAHNAGQRWLVGMGSTEPTHEYDPVKRRFTLLPPRNT